MATGVYLPNGALNGVLNSDGNGLYNADGAIRFTETDTGWGIYAPDGSYYCEVVEAGTGNGIYNSRGNFRVVAVAEDEGNGLYAPNGAWRSGGFGALGLLAGYDNGLAVDFLTNTVAIKDVATPANNRNNVAVNTVFASGGGSSWTVALSAFPFDPTKGTIYAEGISNGATNTQRTYFQIDDGTNTNRILGCLSTLNGGQFLIVTGGANQANVLPAAPTDAGILHRFAATWDNLAPSGHAQASLDDVLGTQDTSLTLPTVTTLRISGGLLNTAPFNGTGLGGGVHKFVYVPQ